MKYTSPMYNVETIETNDIMLESQVKVAYVEKEVGGQKVTATQVSVDIKYLF